MRREGAIFLELLWGGVCYCLIMLRADKYPNEDIGPLPGPRCCSALAENLLGRCVPPGTCVVFDF